MAALNVLPVKVADIQNYYITAPVKDKIRTVLGNESGEDTGRKSILVHAFYSSKSTIAAFWNHLVDCMHHLGFLTCTDDLDIWMKPMLRPEDGFNYHAYVLIYVMM